MKSSHDAFLQGHTSGSPNPSGKGKRIIILHIGSEDGFVPDGLLCFESKNTITDYSEEMNENTFYDWIAASQRKLCDYNGQRSMSLRESRTNSKYDNEKG